MDTIIRVGGSAGDGVSSTGQVLSRAFSRLGYHVHAYNSYQSVIRGGHVWYNIRSAEQPVESIGDSVDILLAIDKQTAEVHSPLMREGGVVVHDEKKVDVSSLELPGGVRDLPIPAVATVAGIPKGTLQELVRSQFGHKGDKMVQMNFQAIDKGREFAADVKPIREHKKIGQPRPLIPGNECIALGSMAAGLGYYAAYPMTPASTLLHYLAKVGPEQGVVVKQMEDEIGVVNSTIGAAFGGARAMCGTSGGGLALMTEAIGFAGMAEVGIVVMNSMRGGPSTGLPTKTEQADLFQMLGAGQGDYPKMILAPQDPADAYDAAVEAHEIADRYQMPVLLVSDFYLSETAVTQDPGIFRKVEAVDRGGLVAKASNGGFKRYAITESGISPRSIPGAKGVEFVGASDEHDEDASLISDVLAGLPNSLKVRVDQVNKRMRKLETLLNELPAPQVEGEGDTVLVCWGSTGPALREARRALAKQGTPTQQLTLRYIHPFHSEEVRNLLKDRRFLVVEASASGQLEDYLRMRTGLFADGNVRRYDGEPFTPRFILNAVQEAIAA